MLLRDLALDFIAVLKPWCEFRWSFRNPHVPLQPARTCAAGRCYDLAGF